jgi:hypothetical protein
MNKLILIAIVLFLTSCGQNNTPKELNSVDVKKEVIAIHDLAMEQMPTIQTIQAELTEFNVDSQYNGNIALLDSAHNEMMRWMYQYKYDSASVEYQQEELVKITSINDFTSSSILEAKAALKNATK